MEVRLDNLLADIASAGEAGLAFAKIRDKALGKSIGKGDRRVAELRDHLASLVSKGDIRGPLKAGASQYYFAAGRGPTIDTVSAVVAGLVLQSGVKLLSKVALEKKVKGLNKRFFAEAVSDAVAERAILEVSIGRSKYYLHREVAMDRLGFDGGGVIEAKTSGSSITFEDLRRIYRRLSSEQGGFAAVKIYDIIRVSNAAMAAVHALLIEEAKTGRVTLQPSNSVNLPREVVDAAIRLNNFPEPFITAIFVDDT